MFLLIQIADIMHYDRKYIFTFHNVSINTNIALNVGRKLTTLHSTMFLLIRHSLCQGKRPRETLHSTMFLLIRKLSCRSPILQSSFTFHNVSINTAAPAPWANQVYLPLHSTMFLLIQRCLKCRQVLIFFTFHNVSINTCWRCCLG